MSFSDDVVTDSTRGGCVMAQANPIDTSSDEAWRRSQSPFRLVQVGARYLLRMGYIAGPYKVLRGTRFRLINEFIPSSVFRGRLP